MEVAIKKESMRENLHYLCMGRAGRRYSKPGSANCGPWKERVLLLIFINKVLLELFIYILSRTVPSTIITELSGGGRNLMAFKA